MITTHAKHSASQFHGRRVVLHVVACWDVEVRAAVMQFIERAPEVEHHLLRAGGTALLAGDRGDDLASVRELPSGLLASRRAVRDAVGEIRPDVVHAHSRGAGTIVRTAIVSTPIRRVVYSPHGDAFEQGRPTLIRGLVARAVERLLARNTDTIAARVPGEAASRAAKRVPRVVEVPSVARISALAMLERRHPGRVLGIGRIGSREDSDFFLSALGALAAERPEVTAWWIGDGGDHSARYRLEQGGVHVTGWLPTFDAQRAVGAGGVYLHTAGAGGDMLSIVEAIELGIPVVARTTSDDGTPTATPTASPTATPTATPGITTPAEMAAAAAAIIAGGDTSRQSNLDAWAAVLAHHTADRQARALRAIYHVGSSKPLLVNGSWLSASSADPARGYATAVTRRLLDIDPGARIVVPRDADLPDWLPASRALRSRARGVLFEQVALPWRARRSMLVNVARSSPAFTRDQLVVMHDADHPRPSRLTVRRARHLAAVSGMLRDELAVLMGVETWRFAVMAAEDPSSADRAAADLLALATDAWVPTAKPSAVSPHPGLEISLSWPPPTARD